MEYYAGPEYDYSDVVETLSCMFGDVICIDVIRTVVESCGGNCKYNEQTSTVCMYYMRRKKSSRIRNSIALRRTFCCLVPYLT